MNDKQTRIELARKCEHPSVDEMIELYQKAKETGEVPDEFQFAARCFPCNHRVGAFLDGLRGHGLRNIPSTFDPIGAMAIKKADHVCLTVPELSDQFRADPRALKNKLYLNGNRVCDSCCDLFEFAWDRHKMEQVKKKIEAQASRV